VLCGVVTLVTGGVAWLARVCRETFSLTSAGGVVLGVV
jgi:hypothetical protein